MAFAPELKKIIEAAVVAAVTAVLVWFGTGLNPAWPLLWFAPLPVLLYAGRARWWTTAGVAFTGWLIGDLNLWGYLHHYIQMPLGVTTGIVAGYPLMFAIAVLLYRALLRRSAAWYALLVFPATLVTFEYLLNLAWQNGTAMNLAYTQLSFLPFLQLASITGPWGMSFLLLLFPAAIATSLHVQRVQPGLASVIVGISLAAIVVVLIFGTVRLGVPQQSQTVRVGLLASDGTDFAAPPKDAMRLFRAYAERVRKLATHGAKVVVLPEAIAVVIPGTQPAADALFQSLSDQTGTAIVVGAVYATEGKTAYNRAKIYTPFEPALTYTKHHLLMPFGARFTAGRTLTTFTTSRGRWGVEICKDMDFTQLSRKYGRLGVGLMLVPGSDFNVDRAFHGHMAIMRGVESGFSLAHSARHGYLTVSDDRGRILGQTRSDSAPFATVLANVPVAHDGTMFLVWGDWFAWLAMAILVCVLVKLIWLAFPNAQQGKHA